MTKNKVFKISALVAALAASINVQADQVILDDLIVDGSICVGQDCVNGESFGFDTLRLKENNLRIRAVDTSNSASFPTRDWQITFNDSSNGGANKFSIDDIDGARTPFTLEAGAPSHSLYVDDGGRLGLGTSTPVTDIHVKTGNTPTLRLEQDGSSGFTAQTWDVAANEANFFVRDATNGSKLSFRIRPGAPESSIDIAADGDVGIGTSSPDGLFDVAHSADANDHAFLIDPSSNVGVNIQNGGTVNGLFDVQDGSGSSHLNLLASGEVIIGKDGTQTLAVTNSHEPKFKINGDSGVHNSIIFNSPDTNKVMSLLFTAADTKKWFLSSRNSANNESFIIYDGNAADVMTFEQGGKIGFGLGSNTLVSSNNAIEHSNGASLTTAGVWTNASSRELKENIFNLTSQKAFEALKNLTPVTYNYKVSPNDNYVGFIAEDVPSLVASSDRKGLASMDIVAVLTKVVQEQQKQIEVLQEIVKKK